MNVTWTVLHFPSELGFDGRRSLRKDLLGALRVSGSSVIVDLSGRQSLDHDDIDLLLECVAHAAGRDHKLVIVASSRVLRALLEVSRISSVVPICGSAEEALADPQVAAETIQVPANVPANLNDIIGVHQ
jgi:anti-anti-sigma regulatory factor